MSTMSGEKKSGGSAKKKMKTGTEGKAEVKTEVKTFTVKLRSTQTSGVWTMELPVGGLVRDLKQRVRAEHPNTTVLVENRELKEYNQTLADAGVTSNARIFLTPRMASGPYSPESSLLSDPDVSEEPIGGPVSGLYANPWPAIISSFLPPSEVAPKPVRSVTTTTPSSAAERQRQTRAKAKHDRLRRSVADSRRPKPLATLVPSAAQTAPSPRTPLPQTPKAKPAKSPKDVCAMCNRRFRLIDTRHTCRCDAVFCNAHRLPHNHHCTAPLHSPDNSLSPENSTRH